MSLFSDALGSDKNFHNNIFTLSGKNIKIERMEITKYVINKYCHYGIVTGVIEFVNIY